MTESKTPSRAEALLWARHANPKREWSRLPTGAVLVYAVYLRDWEPS